MGLEKMEQDVRAIREHGSLTDGAAFVDGRFVPVAEARIPILDWGFLRSDATYDVTHVWRGRFFTVRGHLGPLRKGEKRGGLRDAYAEVICTRGVPPRGSRDPRDCANNFFAFVVPFVWIADPEKQQQGLHAVISRVQRIQPGSVDPTVKNYHWLDLEVGLYDAYDRGGETRVLLNPQD